MSTSVDFCVSASLLVFSFYMYVEMGWLGPDYHATCVFLFKTLGYNFELGIALVSRKGRAGFVFCSIDTPGFWAPRQEYQLCTNVNILI